MNPFVCLIENDVNGPAMAEVLSALGVEIDDLALGLRGRQVRPELLR